MRRVPPGQVTVIRAKLVWPGHRDRDWHVTVPVTSDSAITSFAFQRSHRDVPDRETLGFRMARSDSDGILYGQRVTGTVRLGHAGARPEPGERHGASG